MAVATFESTLTDIRIYSEVGEIKSAGVADALTQRIRAADLAVNEHDSYGASEALNGFKSLVEAELNKQIIGGAQAALLDDADSLISQLP
jgi:hypothetical protein